MFCVKVPLVLNNDNKNNTGHYIAPRMRLKSGGPVSVHKIPSHSLKKSRSLWLVMMSDHAPTHKKRKQIKNLQKCAPSKTTVVAEVCGEAYYKNDINMSKDVKITPQNKKGTQREKSELSFTSL